MVTADPDGELISSVGTRDAQEAGVLVEPHVPLRRWVTVEVRVVRSRELLRGPFFPMRQFAALLWFGNSLIDSSTLFNAPLLVALAAAVVRDGRAQRRAPADAVLLEAVSASVAPAGRS